MQKKTFERTDRKYTIKKVFGITIIFLAMFASLAGASPTTVLVTANGGWVNTGINLQPNDLLVIHAEGSWTTDNGASGYFGPDGSTKKNADNFFNLIDIGKVNSYGAKFKEGDLGALIGYIGDNPPKFGSYISSAIRPEAKKVFLVGSNSNHKKTQSGTLWLNINDDAYSGYTSDNKGSVSATIEVDPQNSTPSSSSTTAPIVGLPIPGPAPNIFYPGIFWNDSNKPEMQGYADKLEARLMPSYYNTTIISGVFEVLQLINNNPSPINYPSDDYEKYNEGNYKIAFAHSGGTLTLVKKIKNKIVHPEYVVLASPCLIQQSDLTDLVENYSVKKVLVIQSPADFLHRKTLSKLINGDPDNTNPMNKDNTIMVKTLSYTTRIDGFTVHNELRQKMVDMFYNSEPPFDGTTIPGLKGLK